MDKQEQVGGGELYEFMRLVDRYLDVSGIRGRYNCGESNKLHKEIEWWIAGKPKTSIMPLLEALGIEPPIAEPQAPSTTSHQTENRGSTTGLEKGGE